MFSCTAVTKMPSNILQLSLFDEFSSNSNNQERIMLQMLRCEHSIMYSLGLAFKWLSNSNFLLQLWVYGLPVCRCRTASSKIFVLLLYFGVML